MSSIPALALIEHPGAWRACDVSKADFSVPLEARHLEALDQALQSAKRKTDDAEQITRDDFRLDAIEDDIKHWREQVMFQSGIVILKGFPLESYSNEEMGMIHFGLGTHFGDAMSQSVMGDRLGHVVDVGGKDPKERTYRNSTELDMHTDACDIVAMMCLQKAQTGGYSGYVSALSIYNEIRHRAPELMPVLIAGVTPFPFKVITIMSGWTGLPLGTFIITSIIARGLRFFVVAALLWKFGAPIRDFIERRLGLMFTLFIVIHVALVFIVHPKYNLTHMMLGEADPARFAQAFT